MAIDPEKKYTATFTTSRGEIVCALFPKEAANTVNNFVFLAKDGFYNGTTFHRVIADFMIQGGDPTGTGRGGKFIWGKPFEDEITPDLRFDKTGVLAMANAGPGTNGSQFFITHAPQPHLDGKHTVFGKVTSDQAVVDSIRQGDKMPKVVISEA